MSISTVRRSKSSSRWKRLRRVSGSKGLSQSTVADRSLCRPLPWPCSTSTGSNNLNFGWPSAWGSLPDADASVFCNHHGELISPNLLTVIWAQALARAGLPKITFHALRHSHASALISEGIDVVSVSRRLGHSSPVITLSTYAHLFADKSDSAAAAIERLLK